MVRISLNGERGCQRYAISFYSVPTGGFGISDAKVAYINVLDARKEYSKAVAKRLEKLVAERTQEHAQSNEDLQQFAHVASHDLKEPIRKIKTFCTFLIDGLAE